jgi:hypothetical protein
MEKSTGGISLTFVVFIVFLILKLTNNIDWSWWWVTSPLWIPIAIALVFICLILSIAFILVILGLSFGMSLDDIQEKTKKIKNKS